MYLEKRGEGFHHICYEVDDISAAVVSLKALGIDIIGEPRPGIEGLSVFPYPCGTHEVLLELVEKGKLHKGCWLLTCLRNMED